MKNILLALVLFCSVNAFGQACNYPNSGGSTFPVNGIVYSYRGYVDTFCWYWNRDEVKSYVASQGGSSGVTSITAGTGLTGGTITSSGTIALQQPYFDTTYSFTVVGGQQTYTKTIPSGYAHVLVSPIYTGADISGIANLAPISASITSTTMTLKWCGDNSTIFYPSANFSIVCHFTKN